MLLSPQIIHTCDHSINELKTYVITDTIVRSEEETDVVCTDGALLSVYSLYVKGDESEIFFYEDIDFKVYDSRRIEWLTDSPPIKGSTYEIEYIKKYRIAIEGDAESCPRCGGNGWYVDLFGQDGNSVKVVTGITKLIQDFMKILLTYKSEDYGSRLLNIVANNMSNIDNLGTEITKVIYEAVAELKFLQQTDPMASSLMANSEKLKDVVIRNIEPDLDSGKLYLEILVISEEEDIASLNLGI
jgi:hypothetical protein